jgi:serine protein kinase
MNILSKAGKRLVSVIENEMTLEEYLNLCKTDKLTYATASERLLHAVGEADMVDTRKDERLSRIFSNDKIPTYKTFTKIYGIENTLKDLISFVKHAAQGLEERKQILYLLGPVGSSKSSIVTILKRLMETVPLYAIKDSPVFDNPLSLFSIDDAAALDIPERYFGTIRSPWLIKRVNELNGDISQLKVVKLYPSEAHQIAISHIEPGDENNQDISSLVGKLNIRELDQYAQNDPDAYSYSGGLCLGNRGIAEFAEMFKSPIKSLNPLLEATQSGFYKGTESISAIPFEGIIIAHSNESEWQKFRNDKRNEALIDRIFIVRVPYCLRYSEETKIYEKMLRESSLSQAPCAPKTLETLAQFSVMSRLIPSQHSSRDVKMRIYNGENLKHKNPDAKNVPEYKKEAHEHESGADEGFSGISTRFAFKILAQTFNYDSEEVGANPLHLLLILNDRIKQEHLSKDEEDTLLAIIQHLYQEFHKHLDKEIKQAYIDSYDEYGQNLFDRYVTYADHWLEDNDYRDSITGLTMSSTELEKFLEEVEVPANVSNKKDFRNEVVKYCLRYRTAHDGQNPKWSSYNKIREVLEAKIFSNIDEMLPIISSNQQGSADERKHHKEFVERMMKAGYTAKQVTLLVDWFLKSSKE